MKLPKKIKNAIENAVRENFDDMLKGYAPMFNLNFSFAGVAPKSSEKGFDVICQIEFCTFKNPGVCNGSNIKK